MLQVAETTSTTKRLSKWRRAENPPPHILTDRDRAIVAAVADYRLLARSQIQRLFFGTTTRTNFRLQKLFHNGYLRRHFLPVLHGSSQAIYSLDRLGLAVAAERLGKDSADLWRPKGMLHPFFLAHQLAVSDVRIALELSARERADHVLQTWLSAEGAQDRFFFGTVYQTLTPDAFFRYRAGRQVLSAFLEVDRGTMPNRRFREKVDRYVAYDASGRYADRYRGQHFRVLVVTNSQERLANLKRTTAQVTSRYFWFTTLTKLRDQGPLAAIWEPVERPEPGALFNPALKEAYGR